MAGMKVMTVGILDLDIIKGGNHGNHDTFQSSTNSRLGIYTELVFE